MRRSVVLMVLPLVAACSGSGSDDGRSVRAVGSTMSIAAGAEQEADASTSIPVPIGGVDPFVKLASALVSAWHDGDRERANELVADPSVLDEMFSQEPAAPEPTGAINVHCTDTAGNTRCSYPATTDGRSLVVEMTVVDGVTLARSVELQRPPAPPTPLPTVTTRP